MKIVLYYWPRQWQSVRFDTTTGRGNIRWLSRKPAHCVGWAYRYNRIWYSIRSDGANLLFQAGSQNWPMDTPYDCSTTRVGRERQFGITNGKAPILRLSYRLSIPNWDPAYDDADPEEDDFFHFVATMWRDSKWKAETVKNWTSPAASPQTT